MTQFIGVRLSRLPCVNAMGVACMHMYLASRNSPVCVHSVACEMFVVEYGQGSGTSVVVYETNHGTTGWSASMSHAFVLRCSPCLPSVLLPTLNLYP